MKIGKLKLKNNIFLAPMVDVTDLPYRLLCRRGYSVLSKNRASLSGQRPGRPPRLGQRESDGCGMAYTEMVYVDALLYENKKTKMMVKTNKEDSPLGLQITGNNEREIEKFVKKRKLWKDFDLIDLNCGCPSSRIAGNEAGSFLLNNPEKIGHLVGILKKTGKPVTVKIRLGFRQNNVLEVVHAIEKAGADALTVHARLATHGYDKGADWKWIKFVRKKVKIPVIGNGDVFSGKDAKKLLRDCDGVMIARGAIGDPLIFSRVLDYLENGEEKEFNVEKNREMFKGYLKLESEIYGNDVDLGKVKYVGAKFLRGFKGAARMREQFMKCKSLSEIESFLETT